MKYRDFLQKMIYKIIDPLIKGMYKSGITPNMITTVGFIGNLAAAGFFIHAAYIMGAIDLDANTVNRGLHEIGWGGAILLFSSLFDLMDGRLARIGHLSSSFGAMWDSTLDRYSELITLFGICLVFLRFNPDPSIFELKSAGPAQGFWWGVITFTAMVGSVMVSYVRARAEGLGIECKVGLMQRPERVVVTAVTAILTGCTKNLWWVAGGMALIALLANITAFWRVAYCYKPLKEKELKEKETYEKEEMEGSKLKAIKSKKRSRQQA
ncbi:MAG: CDP-alcohol phosphatidyltransferase family protein [Prevotella sp.]|jgi:CDP-diacylglycerol--glycerol-3-phosphate 3-phosphatidyltransferase|nr:CDP-alcohol phosphatidyltransferase family protein [Prevotella sp.]MCI2088191.1 CDP-alcohol phosphatidyltransferase family protein [Prevotella sp.]MCI2125718.1 CDP-alcohol phosphatidyltransferase family protein [Prevotella sp.]